MYGNTARAENAGLADFAALHFATDGKHIGNVQIFGRKPGNVPYRIGFYPAPTIGGILENLCLWKQDYYITANTFCGGARTNCDLFGLNNIVVDIDCHGAVSGAQRAYAIDALEYYLQEDLRDMLPNSFVRTGRGVQLWWALEPASARNPAAQSAVTELREALQERLAALLTEEPALQCMSMDRSTSNNLAGLFRLPGAYNTQADAWGGFEILHTRRLELQEAAKELAAAAVTRRKQKVIRMPEGGLDAVSVAIFRSRKLRELLALRQSRGMETAAGHRDLFTFVEFNSWGTVLEDEDQIMEKVRELNSRFAEPLPERELVRNLKTSGRKRYKLSNEKIIEKLDITEEEQQKIGFFPGGQGKNNSREARRAAARAAKAERDQQIVNLYQSGMSQQETAERAGCSVGTVCRVLRREGVKLHRETAREQSALLTAVGDIVAKIGCCRQTAYRYLDAAAEMAQEAVEAVASAGEACLIFFKNATVYWNYRDRDPRTVPVPEQPFYPSDPDPGG
ncbi:MAG: helix-turn-helix domain-containing protein [Faecousia sp.]